MNEINKIQYMSFEETLLLSLLQPIIIISIFKPKRINLAIQSISIILSFYIHFDLTFICILHTFFAYSINKHVLSWWW